MLRTRGADPHSANVMYLDNMTTGKIFDAGRWPLQFGHRLKRENNLWPVPNQSTFARKWDHRLRIEQKHRSREGGCVVKVSYQEIVELKNKCMHGRNLVVKLLIKVEKAPIEKRKCHVKSFQVGVYFKSNLAHTHSTLEKNQTGVKILHKARFLWLSIIRSSFFLFPPMLIMLLQDATNNHRFDITDNHCPGRSSCPMLWI